MVYLQLFIIRQKVLLVNDVVKWIDICSFTREHEAREAFEKAKKKSGEAVSLIKKIEENLA